MFCKHCASEIDNDVIICPKCMKQVQELKGAEAPQVVINNSNMNSNTNTNSIPAYVTTKKKSVAIVLCVLGFFGLAGLHKFYEGKPIMGILYLVTVGFFFIGTAVDLIALLAKPSIYTV